jgi:hypothetical protein
LAYAKSLGGLQFFYDASQPKISLYSDTNKTTPAAVDGPVRLWADLSGHGRDLIEKGDNTAPPTYTGDGVFISQYKNLNLPTNFNSMVDPADSFTLITLSEYTDTSYAQGRIFGAGDNSYRLDVVGARAFLSSRFVNEAPQSNLYFEPAISLAIKLLSVVFDNDSDVIAIKKNNLQVAQRAAAFGCDITPTSTGVFSSGYGSGAFSMIGNGLFATLFNRALTDGEHTEIFEMLKEKFGDWTL